MKVAKRYVQPHMLHFLTTLKSTRRHDCVSSMIPSARPTVPPVSFEICFVCEILNIVGTDGRSVTTCENRDHFWHDCGSAEWIKIQVAKVEQVRN